MRVWMLSVLAVCLVLCVAQYADAQATRDQSPHRVGMVQRDGVRLHYLTWGTSGPTIVLLPGFSLTAHAFDDIGPGLAVGHRVVALTPRGFGESDAPDSAAYTINALIEDLRTLLDSLHIDRAALVAHSISGTVAAHFALRFPHRVSHVVLLDAFPYFAAAGGDAVAALDPIHVPPFRGDTTYEAAAVYLARYRYVPWRPALEADLRAKPLGKEAERRRALTTSYIADQWRQTPDVRRLTVPALEVCAVASVSSEYPWLRPSDPQYALSQAYVTQKLTPFNRALCQRFAKSVPGGRIAHIAGSHYVFFTQPEQTVAVVRRFLNAP